MQKDRTALVLVKNVPAALLTKHAQPGAQRYELRYLPEYLQRKPCHMVCYHMPPRPEPYYSEYLFPFFSNMLPEGEFLKTVCRSCKLDETDCFGQLVFLARYDSIGDVTVQEITEP